MEVEPFPSRITGEFSSKPLRFLVLFCEKHFFLISCSMDQNLATIFLPRLLTNCSLNLLNLLAMLWALRIFPTWTFLRRAHLVVFRENHAEVDIPPTPGDIPRAALIRQIHVFCLQLYLQKHSYKSPD